MSNLKQLKCWTSNLKISVKIWSKKFLSRYLHLFYSNSSNLYYHQLSDETYFQTTCVHGYSSSLRIHGFASIVYINEYSTFTLAANETHSITVSDCLILFCNTAVFHTAL